MTDQSKIIGALLTGVTIGLTIGVLLETDKREKLVHFLGDMSVHFKDSVTDQHGVFATLLNTASHALKSLTNETSSKLTPI